MWGACEARVRHVWCEAYVCEVCGMCALPWVRRNNKPPMAQASPDTDVQTWTVPCGQQCFSASTSFPDRRPRMHVAPQVGLLVVL